MIKHLFERWFCSGYLILFGSKEEVAAIVTGKCPFVSWSRSRGCNVDVIPEEVVSLEMFNDLCKRLDALGIGDLVHDTLHHLHVAIGGQDAGLNETLSAEHFKMQVVSNAV